MEARSSQLFFKIVSVFCVCFNHIVSSDFLPDPLPQPRFYILKVSEHDFLGRRTLLSGCGLGAALENTGRPAGGRWQRTVTITLPHSSTPFRRQTGGTR